MTEVILLCLLVLLFEVRHKQVVDKTNKAMDNARATIERKNA